MSPAISTVSDSDICSDNAHAVNIHTDWIDPRIASQLFFRPKNSDGGDKPLCLVVAIVPNKPSKVSADDWSRTMFGMGLLDGNGPMVSWAQSGVTIIGRAQEGETDVQADIKEEIEWGAMRIAATTQQLHDSRITYMVAQQAELESDP